MDAGGGLRSRCDGVAVGSAPGAAGPHAGAVAQLDSFYSIKLHNIPEHLNADGVLTGIRETSQGTIRGVLNIQPPLYGGGPFEP